MSDSSSSDEDLSKFASVAVTGTQIEHAAVESQKVRGGGGGGRRSEFRECCSAMGIA